MVGPTVPRKRNPPGMPSIDPNAAVPATPPAVTQQNAQNAQNQRTTTAAGAAGAAMKETSPQITAGTSVTAPGGPPTIDTNAPPNMNNIAPPPPPAAQSTDDMINSFVQDQFNPIDTTAAKAQIERDQQSMLGNNLYNQRAAVGAAGFGGGGLGIGLENDARRKAAEDTSRAMIGVDQQAAQDQFTRGQGASQTDISMRDEANKEAQEKAIADALAAITGQQPAPPGAPSAGGGGGGGLDILGDQSAIGKAINTGTSPFGKGTDQTQLAAAQGQQAVTTGGQAQEQSVMAAPAGARLDSVDADGTKHYSMGGKRYVVRAKG